MRQGITDAVKHLLIINVLMFIGTMSIGDGKIFYQWFALYFPKNDAFEPWQIVTHMFMHGDFMHILFNMFALWMFGTAVEQMLDTKKFIIFYLLSGLGAALIQIAFLYFRFNTGLEALTATGLETTEIINVLNEGKYDTRWQAILGSDFELFVRSFSTMMVGASGAIMGVLVAFGMLFPESKLMLIFLPIPIKAKYFIPAIIGLDLFSGLTGQSIFSPSNTAYMAHVGGAFTGFLLMWFWRKNENNKYRWN
ncbi:MAG: rhomboid family intramembrane serine protease [Winogradskyella sp.]|nr:rhomboid family intramembrane serine protease [Winogradskyella sp.]MBT8376149.1 rhomboid family intramembrane serine protease [Bacteroidia bacterium]NNC46245.1 rhomboid family intramembrane serine protease [Winogradskyella sp.]NNF85998.1 rhomboid family intramembrane serine protease [Winogradskyella sp.]NNL81972.1 rhomboid family intramembrane serine protease [Winogradskyella sp.]